MTFTVSDGEVTDSKTISIIVMELSLQYQYKIAFTSSRDDNDEIYVMNGDGSNQTQLTDNSANYIPIKNHLTIEST